MSVNIAGAEPTQQQQQMRMQKAWDEVVKVRQAGPAEISLSNQGKLRLPQGFYYVPLETRLVYGAFYIGLIVFLALMANGVHEMLGALRSGHNF